MADTVTALSFSDAAQLDRIAEEHGTPVFVHDELSYRRAADEALSAPNAFGLTVRYAMKANPHRAILQLFDSMGIHIDASSIHEVHRAMAAGIDPRHIELTCQQPLSSRELISIAERGVLYNAASLLQLSSFGQAFHGVGRSLSVRVNPGLGSGHNNRTSTGGPTASFGIWHEYLDQVRAIAGEHGLRITHLHTHVGSGSDWKVWQQAARATLDIVRELPDVAVVNLGGGYKVDRMDPANSMRFGDAFPCVRDAFRKFARETGRELKLEIEPGTYLVANGCLLLARVCDMVDTGASGYRFLKLDTSMTELLRPMIYGARHPIAVVEPRTDERAEFVVVGTCCESGDIFTPCEGDPERVDTIALPVPDIGDLVAIMGAGAYGSAMSAGNYNSRPMCAEVMIDSSGEHRLITRRQGVEEMWVREE